MVNFHVAVLQVFVYNVMSCVQDDYNQVESMASSKQKEVESLSEALTELQTSASSPQLQVRA